MTNTPQQPRYSINDKTVGGEVWVELEGLDIITNRLAGQHAKWRRKPDVPGFAVISVRIDMGNPTSKANAASLLADCQGVSLIPFSEAMKIRDDLLKAREQK